MSRVDTAIERLRDGVTGRIDAIEPFRAVVTGTSGGMVTIRRLDETTGETELRGRLPGFHLQADDVVACISINGKPFVLGLSQNSAPSAYTLDVPLVVGTDDGDALTVHRLKATGDTAPTASALTAAGSGADASLIGFDAAGRVDLTTGSSAVTSGEVVEVEFSPARTAFGYHILLTPANADTAANAPQFHIDQNDRLSTSWKITAGQAPATETTYRWTYLIVDTT